MDVFIGTITPFGFNFAPRGWQTCAGQVLPISQFSALFSLLGTLYGGDGRTSFQLPNLQGRTPLGMGNGAGLTPRLAGQAGGAEATTLAISNMPSHNHTATANLSVSGKVQVSTNTTGNTAVPSATNNFLSASGGGQGTATIWSNALTAPVDMGGVSVAGSGTVTIANNGGGQPAPIMNPFLVLNFCIAMEGIFPSRN